MVKCIHETFREFSTINFLSRIFEETFVETFLYFSLIYLNLSEHSVSVRKTLTQCEQNAHFEYFSWQDVNMFGECHKYIGTQNCFDNNIIYV